MKINKIILNFFFTILFFNLSCCGLKVVDNHGQIVGEDVNYESIEVGKNKQQIESLLGSPSTKSNFDDEKTWFYISSEFRKFVFLDGKNTNQKILMLTFENDTLKNKEILTQKDINDIEFEETVTDSRGKKLSWFKQFFMNLNPNPYGRKTSN